ncbi:hypothetical protein, partial [Nonomuraea cavernae]|uniref:hypothetical protein n=1 Tax=Nonomuraea cavernae TaxID=2045107 RepID=UPI001E2F3354
LGSSWSLNQLPETSSVIDHRHAASFKDPFETRPRALQAGHLLLVQPVRLLQILGFGGQTERSRPIAEK